MIETWDFPMLPRDLPLLKMVLEDGLFLIRTVSFLCPEFFFFEGFVILENTLKNNSITVKYIVLANIHIYIYTYGIT